MKDKYLSPLSDGHSLEVFYKEDLIFFSSRHWLNPLFEFEDWLKVNPINNRSFLSIHDSIDGRAAAMLTFRLGIKRVNSDIMSSLAKGFFEKNGVEIHYGTLVKKILCITEDILSDDMDIEEVYQMLAQRAARISVKDNE